MAGRERRLERAAWLMQREMEEVGSELRNARLAAGLTLRQVGLRVGVSASAILDTERGRLPGPRPPLLARHGAVVGLRARIKLYPDGEPLRDAGQLDLARAFRARVHAHVRFMLEQPVVRGPGDVRAFDAVLLLAGCRCAVEFVTRIHDCQLLLRQVHLKQRDSGVDRVVIVVKGTHHNRRALAAVRDLVMASFPLGTRRVMAALAAGRDPGANGIVLL